MHRWTCPELLLLDMLNMGMPDELSNELEAIISEWLLAKLNIERTLRVCGTRLERIRKKREISGLDEEDERAELPTKRSTHVRAVRSPMFFRSPSSVAGPKCVQSEMPVAA